MCWPGLLQLSSDEWWRMISLQTINCPLGTTATRGHVCAHPAWAWEWHRMCRVRYLLQGCFVRFNVLSIFSRQSLNFISAHHNQSDRYRDEHKLPHGIIGMYKQLFSKFIKNTSPECIMLQFHSHHFKPTKFIDAIIYNNTTHRWGQILGLIYS